MPPKKKIHVQQWDQNMAQIIPKFLRIIHSSVWQSSSPLQRSHHYCHITLAWTTEKGIAFGRYTAGMSFHWQLEAHYCTSFLVPWASEVAGEEMDQVPWPSHLTQCSETCVVFLCCSDTAEAFWETWASAAHLLWELRCPSVCTSLYKYTFCLNTVLKKILKLKEREGKK